MQGKSTMIVDYGMPGISATLVSNNYIRILGKIVHHSTLSLISPVDTADYFNAHN